MMKWNKIYSRKQQLGRFYLRLYNSMAERKKRGEINHVDLMRYLKKLEIFNFVLSIYTRFDFFA